jgi:hypothetical protein
MIERRPPHGDDNDDQADPEPDRPINAATNQSPAPPINIHTNAEQLRKGGYTPKNRKHEGTASKISQVLGNQQAFLIDHQQRLLST